VDAAGRRRRDFADPEATSQKLGHLRRHPSICEVDDAGRRRLRGLRAALDVLIDEGRDAVTHQRPAQVAGYSRATLYKHWPTRADLLRDAFGGLRDAHHHTPTGDVRTDLIAELTAFRSAIEHRRIDRALAALAELTASHPDMADVRDEVVSDGERVLRGLLAPTLHGPKLEAATLMLAGAILNAAMMHGRPPADDVIAAAV
jgi:AcrR family transcriptional regulator